MVHWVSIRRRKQGEVVLSTMRDQMIEAMKEAALSWEEIKLGKATWYKIGPGRADRIILQDDRFTASSPASMGVLDSATRKVQNPRVTDGTVHYVSLVDGVNIDVQLPIIDSIRVMVAPEARETRSVDRTAFTVAADMGLVVEMSHEHHIGLTEKGQEVLRITALLRST